MANTEDLTLTVGVKTGDSQSKLQTLNMSITDLAKGFALGDLASQAITKTWGYLESAISSSIAAWNESEAVVAQLNAVLESTQHAAGMSAQELINLSQSLQATTKFSDETILSAENLLLTFTSIGKEVFPQATQTVLDMATALGTDANGAAIQLGKALQDPILGITALRRVGVNFNESQLETIKTLVQTNRTLDAQKLILAELSKEFGGSATAAAKTFAGQMAILENQANDVSEEIGHGLTAAFYNLILSFKDATAGGAGFNDVGKTTFQIMGYIEEFAVNLGAAIWNLGQGFVILGSYIAQTADILYNFGNQNAQFWTDFRQSAVDGANAATDFAMNLHQRNQETADSFDELTSNSKTFGAAAPAAYQATKQAASEAASKIKDANQAIAQTKQKIVDLNEAFLQVGIDTGRGYAEAYVAQEQKVADLKKQIMEESDFSRKSALQLELNQEQIALDAHQNIKTDLLRDYTEAYRRSKETEFERTVEDIGRKYDAETKAYLKKAELLEKELKDNEMKRNKLAGFEVQTTATAITENRKRTATVEQEANNQIAAAQRAASAISNMYGAASGGSLNFSMGIVPLGLTQHEFGGTVPGLKGQPQLIIAHGGETVVQAGQSAGGGAGNVVVNINNPMVATDSDVERLKQQIEEVMRPLLLNAKLVHI